MNILGHCWRKQANLGVQSNIKSHATLNLKIFGDFTFKQFWSEHCYFVENCLQEDALKVGQIQAIPFIKLKYSIELYMCTVAMCEAMHILKLGIIPAFTCKNIHMYTGILMYIHIMRWPMHVWYRTPLICITSIYSELCIFHV